MEGFINWGSESPEQRRIRQRWEEDLLFEQARMKAMALQAAGAVGSGRSGCYPPGGVLLKVNVAPEPDLFVDQNFFLAQSGSRNGRPSYELPSSIAEGDSYLNSSIKISWNGSLWELIQEFQTPEEDESTVGATSTELYGSWDSTVFGPILVETVPGTEFQCQYRYCASGTGSGGNFSLFAPFMVPTWVDTPLEGPPNSYLTLFGEGPTLFWREDLQQWIIGEGLDEVEIGGTRDSLPVGILDLGDGFELTISEGFCDPNQNSNA
jgi:hypothetical protein